MGLEWEVGSLLVLQGVLTDWSIPSWRLSVYSTSGESNTRELCLVFLSYMSAEHLDLVSRGSLRAQNLAFNSALVCLLARDVRGA